MFGDLVVPITFSTSTICKLHIMLKRKYLCQIMELFTIFFCVCCFVVYYFVNLISLFSKILVDLNYCV